VEVLSNLVVGTVLALVCLVLGQTLPRLHSMVALELGAESGL
jgi:hypothetical protein